jgi:vacuolar-type H+-ATPase subunit H
VVSIDILYLVDRLENALNTGQRVPFTNKIMVDERECLDIVDQMRIVVPEEIKQARRVSQDRDRITGQAQEEAERIMNRAHEQAEQLMDEEGLLDRAREREREIIEEAELQAQEIRDQADQYAFQILDDLNRRLGPILSQVQAGIDSLRPRAMAAPSRNNEVREREPVPADAIDEDDEG